MIVMRISLSVQQTNIKTLQYRQPGIIPLLLVLALVLQLSGCSTVSYYGQAIDGHFDLLDQRQPIPTLLVDSQTPEPLRQRLQTALTIRRFATDELGLPDNGSYRYYADIKRDFVVWNVVATAPLSLEPRQWCFLLIGCLQYRGYYSEANARAFASSQATSGDDVFVGGATAYSTLGWFDDPVLSTMLRHSDGRLAQIIFHELAHQQLFIKNDTQFNEAFADSVGITGARRWLAAQRDARETAAFDQQLAHENQLIEMIMTTRRKLARVYASSRSEQAKHRRKQQIFTDLRRQYQHLRQTDWAGYPLYDPWFANDLNNAKLAAVVTYRALVPEFMRLQTALDGNLPRFYATVAALADCTPAERRQWLATLQATGDCRVTLAKPVANR